MIEHLDIQEFDAWEGPRIETGAVRFGEDWPGVFIRGDNAAAYATILEMYIEQNRDGAPASDTHIINLSVVKSLVKLLRSCDVRLANTGGNGHAIQ